MASYLTTLLNSTEAAEFVVASSERQAEIVMAAIARDNARCNRFMSDEAYKCDALEQMGRNFWEGAR